MNNKEIMQKALFDLWAAQLCPMKDAQLLIEKATITLEDGLREPKISSTEINPADLRIDHYDSDRFSFSSRRNGIRITHLPTGITAECDSERSEHANRKLAMEKVKAAFALTMSELVDPCQGRCATGQVCRTPSCARGQLPLDHPARGGKPLDQSDLKPIKTEHSNPYITSNNFKPIDTFGGGVGEPQWLGGDAGTDQFPVSTNDWRKNVGGDAGTDPFSVSQNDWRKNVSDAQLMEEVRSRGFEIRDAKIGRKWIGLTDDEIESIYKSIILGELEVTRWLICRAIEEKLKEKNEK